MSHPDPLHDHENERIEDSKFAPRKKMKTIKDIENMQKEPASKEWFKKHGLPKKKHEIAKKMKSPIVREGLNK